MPQKTLVALLAAVGSVGFFATETSAQQTFRKVALTGDTAPGSGAVDGRPDGQFLSGSSAFIVPVISSAGHIAFEGGVLFSTPVPEKPLERGGIWAWDPLTGTLRLVMISGIATPVGGTFGGSFSELRINHDGTVLFDALINGPGPTHLFKASPSSQLSAVVSQNSPAPGVPGGQFGDARLGRGFINNGHVFTNQPLFPANLGNGAWQQSTGTLRPIIVPGMAVPDNANATFSAGAVSAVGGNGKAILRGGVREGTATTDALWHGDADGLRRVATVGQPAPGRFAFEPLTYTGLGEATTNDAGQVAFAGDASSFLSPAIGAIWAGTPGSTPADTRLVARSGDAATNPHFPNDTFGSVSRPGINGLGQIAFQGNTNFNRDGFWVARPNADAFTVGNIVIEGQPVSAPEFGSGVTYSQLSTGFSFNALGQLGFLANLGGSGITTANDVSLWGYDPREGLKLLAQEGRPFLANPGDERLVSSIQFMSGGAGQDGKATGLSDNGSLTFLLGFSNGTRGIFSHSLRPVGIDFFWRGSEAPDDNWHTVTGPNTNWKDSEDEIEQPPGSLGTETVTIRNAPAGGVYITQADVNIGSLDASGKLVVRRTLTLNENSVIENLVLDNALSALRTNARTALGGHNNRWSEGKISADVAAVAAGTAKLVIPVASTLTISQADGAPNQPALDLFSPVELQGDLVLEARVNTDSGARLKVDALGQVEVRDGIFGGQGAVELGGTLNKRRTSSGAAGDFVFTVPVVAAPIVGASLTVRVESGRLSFEGAASTFTDVTFESGFGTTLSFKALTFQGLPTFADVTVGPPDGDPDAPTGEVHLSEVDLPANTVSRFRLNSELGVVFDGDLGIFGGGGKLINDGNATWVEGDFRVAGGLDNHGTLVLPPGGLSQPSNLGTTLTNDGTIDLRKPLNLVTGGRLVHQSGLVRFGPNSGVESFTGDPTGFDMTGGILLVEGNDQRTIRIKRPFAQTGGELRVAAGRIAFSDSFDVSGTAEVFIDAGASLLIERLGSGTLASGRSVSGTGDFDIETDFVAANATLDVREPGSTRVTGDTFHVDGVLRGDAQQHVTNNGRLILIRGQIGDLKHQGGPGRDFTIDVTEGANGRIFGAIENFGSILHSPDSAPLFFDANLTNHPGATYTLDGKGIATGSVGVFSNNGTLLVEPGSLSQTDFDQVFLENLGTVELAENTRFKIAVARWGDAGGPDGAKTLLRGKFVLRNNSVFLVDTPILITALGANATVELHGTGRLNPLSTIDLDNRGTLRLLNSANLVLSGQLENEGTLFIDGTSSLTADEIDNDGVATINGLLNADVTFSSSTEWKGSGIINGALVDGGSGSPANSPGTFTINGNYTQLASARLLIELASASSFDLLSVRGASSLQGALAVALDGDFLPASADTFTFLTAADISGTFSNAPDGSRLFTSDGLGSFLVSYDPGSASLSEYVAVPEPSALCLLLTGTAAAFRRRRRVQS